MTQQNEPTTQSLPGLSDIREAAQLTAPYLHRTPVLSCAAVDRRAGCRVLFKCENFQKVGAFKFRGASNAIFSLSTEAAANGVATHSSGNHAQAVALAARIRGIPAHIVMPENAPGVKKRAVADYGAQITWCEPTRRGRESTLERVVEQTGAAVIHPYDDPRIVSGQGTAALELLGDHPGLRVLLAPVGGGGLISGTAIAAAGIDPEIRVIGCEPKQADDAYRSFKQGKRLTAELADTVADGLRTSIGELPWQCIEKHVSDIVTVSEEEIVDAMRFVWERMKMIIEPSSAVPVAALFSGAVRSGGLDTGIIISGGNVDLDHLPWI